MPKIVLFLLCLILFSCVKESDTKFVVELDEIYDQPSRGFMILSPLSEMEDSLRSNVTFPDLAESKDTSFSKMYFTGKNEGALENSILVLITNYESDTPSIWVDYNNDLNFTTDKPSVQFSDSTLDVSFPNLEKDNLYFTNRLFKVDSSTKARQKESIEKYITKGAPYNDFYYVQRRNVKVGDFSFDEDSMRIGIMDWNVNGRYNEKGEDRLVFGEYGKPIGGIQESEGAVRLDSVTYFQGNVQAFEVTNVAADGSSIELKSTLNSNVEERISKGDALPSFSFKLLSGDNATSSDYLNGGRMLYLNFWANWCAGCHEEVEDLKNINENYFYEVTILSLNYNEGLEKINVFNDKYNVNWANGFSTPEINQMLFVQGLPRNILIDSDGTIIEMNIHPSALLQRLEE